jgi:hypothetical protein
MTDKELVLPTIENQNLESYSPPKMILIDPAEIAGGDTNVPETNNGVLS